MKTREKHDLCVCTKESRGLKTGLGIKAEAPVWGLILSGHILWNIVLGGFFPHLKMGASLREWRKDFKLSQRERERQPEKHRQPLLQGNPACLNT